MANGTEYMPAWAAEHADGMQQLVFGQLVQYLEMTIPGFSSAELMRRVQEILAAADKRTEQNEVTRWMKREESEIISTMIPRSIHDD